MLSRRWCLDLAAGGLYTNLARLARGAFGIVVHAGLSAHIVPQLYWPFGTDR